MNKEQARNLVRQTFTHAFDKARFRQFVLELLNAIRTAGHLHIS